MKMDTSNLAFWLERTERLMKEQQYAGSKGKIYEHANLNKSKDKPRVRRLQFSLINYTVLIERKTKALREV